MQQLQFSAVRLFVFPLALLAFAGPGSAQKKLFSLADTTDRALETALRGSAPKWQWASDGVHLERGTGKEAKWVDISTWEESAPPADEEASREKESRKASREAAERAFAQLTDFDDKTAAKVVARRVAVTEDETGRLYRYEDALWFHRDGLTPLRLTNERQSPELADLSPDGAYVAFVDGNDLHVAATATGRQAALTTSGDDETFNGKLDWVYQEEIYGRGDFKGFWWSPDSARIVFLSLDESAVHEFTVVDHIEDGHFRVKPEVSNYPKVGDPNPTVHVGVADVKSRAIQWLDLARYDGSEPLVVNVGWSPDAKRVIFQVQDRIQTWLDLVAGDPNTGETHPLIHESSPTWVNVIGPPRWLADGSFLWHSERTGWKHLYHYSAAGVLIRPVTGGEWALGSIAHLDEAAHEIVFTSTEGGAVNSNLYRVAFDPSTSSKNAEQATRLTRGDGAHRVKFNDARTHFLDSVSSLAHPTEVRLCRVDGEILKALGRAEPSALEEYEVSSWELTEVLARDGFPLDVTVLKPVPFDANESYPVWIPTYSGPNAPTIRNRWNSSVWSQFLAQQGVIVMQVNVRSASGKGQCSTGQAYKQMLVPELRDLEDAVDWITSHPWADAERVGITGYSYGGSMTAYALTRSKKFALGVAGGGVYDWRMYDTIYTERYMSTPDRNPEGFEKTSVIAGAEGLAGHLLLHCGVMDDNVHMQNTMQLAYALQKAGKQFDLMVYPQSRHGVRDADQRKHLRQWEWTAIQEHLGAGRAVRSKSTSEAVGASAGK